MTSPHASIFRLGKLTQADIEFLQDFLRVFNSDENLSNFGPISGMSVVDGLLSFNLASDGRIEVLDLFHDLTDELDSQFVLVLVPCNDSGGLVVFVGLPVPLTQIDN